MHRHRRVFCALVTVATAAAVVGFPDASLAATPPVRLHRHRARQRPRRHLNCARCGSAEIEAHITANVALFDVDGDGASAALSDGLLILRYLFGFHGAAVTNGAVDTQSCNRCDAAAIEPYIAGLLQP